MSCSNDHKNFWISDPTISHPNNPSICNQIGKLSLFGKGYNCNPVLLKGLKYVRRRRKDWFLPSLSLFCKCSIKSVEPQTVQGVEPSLSPMLILAFSSVNIKKYWGSEVHQDDERCVLHIFPGRILGDVNLNLDEKTALKARGLWEDWHLRQLIDHPSRTNHVSGN